MMLPTVMYGLWWNSLYHSIFSLIILMVESTGTDVKSAVALYELIPSSFVA